LLVIVVIGAICLANIKSNEKVNSNEKNPNSGKEVYDVQNKTNKENSNTNSENVLNNEVSNSKDSQSKVVENKKYENSKYGITFSYPSSFSNHEYSLTTDSVESYSDDDGNLIKVAAFSNDTIEGMIDFEKNKEMPDGTKIKLDIKKEGYVTLNSGLEGYSIETNDNTILFITEKDNTAFRFTITYTDNNDKMANDILNSINIK